MFLEAGFLGFGSLGAFLGLAAVGSSDSLTTGGRGSTAAGSSTIVCSTAETVGSSTEEVIGLKLKTRKRKWIYENRTKVEAKILV